MEQLVACCLQEAGPPPAQRRCLSDTRHPQAPVVPQQQHPHQPQVGCWPDSMHVDHATMPCQLSCVQTKHHRCDLNCISVPADLLLDAPDFKRHTNLDCQAR